MAYQGKVSPIWSDDLEPIGAAHFAWAKWCKKVSDNPSDLKALLEKSSILIDWKTASRWFHGETLPSLARVIQLTAAGASDLPDLILGPAKAAASTVILERKLEQAEQNARAAELEAAELRKALGRKRSGTGG